MRFAELERANVAIWGYGREGRSALAALRRRFPDKPLTLYCSTGEAAMLHDAPDASPAGKADHPRALDVRVQPPDADALSAHDIVIKSPGISAYLPAILAAREHDTRFTSGTALWFGENPEARVGGITGTKGKSTTTALVAHLARSLGVRTALAGNIGLPLLDLDGQHADLWAIELSSFQTGEAGPLELGVIVSLGEDHLDWHGSRERYITDKLQLADVSRTLLVDAAAPLLLQRTAAHPHRELFNDASGWHVGDGTIRRGDQPVVALDGLPLHGAHNARNACAALAAIELLGLDALGAAASLRSFAPLPHRLTSLGKHSGIEWIDDSISTTPDAALAALESLPGRSVALILGGFDRGLDWSGFVRRIGAHAPQALVTQGAAGPRIARALRAAGLACAIEECPDLAVAVARAGGLVQPGGVVLLSPGAPSFDQFKDYVERGRAFAGLAGFDENAVGAIAGLGIA